MKSLVIPIAILALAASLAAEPKAPADGAQQESIKDVFPRFSVVGEWHVTHPWWTDNLILKADGTMVTDRMQTTGRWILTGDGGTPVIVLRWDAYGTESVAMVAPNHFRGQVENGVFMDMRRNRPTAGVENTSPEPAPPRQ
jgi:hypothetical protein